MNVSSRTIYFYLTFSILISLGTWLRVRNIEVRPMHGDEANQAYQFQMLVEDHTYRYEPQDYHGPTLYYMMLPFYKLFGPQSFADAQKWHFRGLTVLFGILTAFGGLLFIDSLGRRGVLLATLFQMISPAMIFYSTYFIQETLLVCFTVFFSGSLWRLWQKPSLKWAISTGAFLGLLHATKETFILTLFALLCAVFAGVALNGFNGFKKFEKKHYLSVFFAALTVSVLFYSSFFTNAQGPLDSLKSFSSQIERGLGGDNFPEHMTSGAAHAKSFSYYVSNIIGYYPRQFSSTVKDVVKNSPARPLTEIFFLFATFVGLFYLKKKGRSHRLHLYTLVFTLVLTLTYSLIPYKTPWCMLSFLMGFIFCSAFTFKFLLQEKKPLVKYLSLAVGVIFILDLSRQALLVNNEYFCTSDRNQYAYVQPVFDVEDMTARINEMSLIEGQGDNMPIHFITPEYWPFPWYLRKFNKVGFWDSGSPQEDLKTLPLVISTPAREDIARQLGETHTAELRGRLPGYYLTVYYRNDLWKAFLKKR